MPLLETEAVRLFIGWISLYPSDHSAIRVEQVKPATWPHRFFTYGQTPNTRYIARLKPAIQQNNIQSNYFTKRGKLSINDIN